MQRYDYHVHSNYSDGDFLWRMVEEADKAGLSGIGFADHCSVSPQSSRRIESHRNGFALDITYERRREGIQAIRSWDMSTSKFTMPSKWITILPGKV